MSKRKNVETPTKSPRNQDKALDEGEMLARTITDFFCGSAASRALIEFSAYDIQPGGVVRFYGGVTFNARDLAQYILSMDEQKAGKQ